ncbi:MAG: SagB/ThcOx family dehydrogenase [bacterium]|nr:SagB/ThcOx family dehydrogenase [bacterium]
MNNNLKTVFRFHDETKHQPQRDARSLGYMDWANQPDPFLRFDGADVRRLSLPEDDTGGPTWREVIAGGLPPAPVDDAAVSRLLYGSMALSAWKEAHGLDGEVAQRWALRVNPSSGNLHPTETWLVREDGLHHYRPDLHALEHAGVGCGWPAGRGLLVGLSSVVWREAWKYGERSFRYCNHDTGHALAAITLAARSLGWEARLLDGLSSELVGRLLGCARRNGPEVDHPDLLLHVGPASELVGVPTISEIEDLRKRLEARGEPSRLSEGHQDWPLVEEVREAVAWPGRGWDGETPAPPIPPTTGDRSFLSLVRGRRSAVSMDGATGLDAEAFYEICRRALPGQVPLPWPAQVSVLLFVHRVAGLPAGPYLLSRSPDHAEELREILPPVATWERPRRCPDDVPLVRLDTADLRNHARALCCTQKIAGDGVFAAAMLARFDEPLHEYGAGFYPRLFWETGVVGQMLYLAAEAAGVRGTGIGCYFDDEVHKMMGLEDHAWQSLYHFTVGQGVDDPRLVTAPAYEREG